MGLRFYFYEFCFVGGAKFNQVLFYLKQEDHQNIKTVNTQKKKKNEEDLRPLVCGFVQERQEIKRKRRKKKTISGFRARPPPQKKGSHLEEKKKLSMFASVGPTNFDIFTIGRKKKRVFLIWCHCKKEFLMCTFNL